MEEGQNEGVMKVGRKDKKKAESVLRKDIKKGRMSKGRTEGRMKVGKDRKKKKERLSERTARRWEGQNKGGMKSEG